MATQTGDEAKKLWEMIGDIRICMMTTIDDDGSLRSRPMAGVQDEFEGELWFFTRASSHKAQEVESHRRVNLSYADPGDQQYMSISGSSEIIRDREKMRRMWSEAVRFWFPQVLDDPDPSLMRVARATRETWYSPYAHIPNP